MIRRFFALLILMTMLLPTPLRAQDQAALWAQDLRLAVVAERIMGANVHLCRNTMPLTGLILHSRDQYGAAQAGWFANGQVAVAQVLPASAAERAGIQLGDGVLAVGGLAVDDLALAAGYPRRDAVFDVLATSSAPVALTIRRAATVEVRELAAPTGCRALVEVLTDGARISRADGRVVQISSGMVTLLDDNGLAATFAHELAHAVLEHRRRLNAGDLSAEDIRRLSRQVELEADLLSVHLLANAGYDPQIAPQMWESAIGRALNSGFLRSRRYASRRERARELRREIADYLTARPLPSPATHLLELRDRPFANQ